MPESNRVISLSLSEAVSMFPLPQCIMNCGSLLTGFPAGLDQIGASLPCSGKRTLGDKSIETGCYQRRPDVSHHLCPLRGVLTLLSIFSLSSVCQCEKYLQIVSKRPGSIQHRRERLPDEHFGQSSRSCPDKTSPLR